MKVRQDYTKVNSAMNLPTIDAMVVFLGEDFTDQKVSAIVCSMARKGLVSIERAKKLLGSRPIVNFLTVPFKTGRKSRTT